MLTAHEERVYADDLQKYPKLQLSLAQSGPPQFNQGKQYFHTLRQFPEVRLSLLEISKINPGEVNERRPKSRNIVHGYCAPRPHTAPKKTKSQQALDKCNSISRKMDKLCGSCLDDIDDHYKVLRRGIVRSRMDRNRAELMKSQPSLRLKELNILNPTDSPDKIDSNDTSNTRIRNYLGRACLKLRKAGLSTLHELSDRNEIISSGFLSILGVTQFTQLTAKQLNSLIQLNLGVKLSDMELLALHTTLFIRKYGSS